MYIISVYRQSVSDGGLLASSEVDLIDTIAGVALAGDGDVVLGQCEMVLAEGSRETIVAYFFDGD